MYLTVFSAHCFDEGEASRGLRGLLRGIQGTSPATAPESALCDLFLPTPLEPGDPPAAAITFLHDTGIKTPRWCLRADPVYLHPRRHELVLISGFGGQFDQRAQLSETEVKGFAEVIETIVKAHEGEFRAAATNRWYLLFDRQSSVRTQPLSAALGRDIDGYLPRGPEAMKWQVMLNELQMQLHDCAVNETREQAGLYPVNSLWFWGGGRLPEVASVSGRWTRVVCDDDELTVGLARLCGIEVVHASSFDLDATGRQGRVLWVAGRGPLWTGNFDLREQETLLAAVRQNDIERLTVIDPFVGTYMIEPRDLSPWRRIGRFVRQTMARNE